MVSLNLALMTPRGRLARHTPNAVKRRLKQWKLITICLWQRVRRGRRSLKPALCYAFQKLKQISDDFENVTREHLLVKEVDFDESFQSMSCERCLELFRFEKQDISKVANVIGWPENGGTTHNKGLLVSRLLATCILLWRFSDTGPWRRARDIFGKFESDLSDIFLSVLCNFVELRKNILQSPLGQRFIQSRARIYAEAIERKSEVMKNCIGFIDGTVIKVARPSKNELQKSCYNGHKRSHALKFQALTLPDGLAIHVGGIEEGRRHDITLWRRSSLEDQLRDILVIDNIQFKIYGDSAYIRKPWFDLPHDGAFLTETQKIENASKSKVRVTTEWVYMEIKRWWTRCDYKRSLKIQQAPYGNFLLAACILTNIRNCLYPNEISQYFEVLPPTLEEYLQNRE